MKVSFIVALGLYVLAIIVAAILLLVEPTGLEAKAMIAPLVAVLFVASLGISYRIATNAKTTALSVAGTLALAVLFTFLGFFVVAGIAWFIAVGHAA